MKKILQDVLFISSGQDVHHFETIKRKLKNEVCQGLVDLLGSNGLIQRSAVNNEEIVYQDPDPESLKQNFPWGDWREFLLKNFESCPGIRDWHVVIIEKDGPFITVKDYVDPDARKVRILKAGSEFSDEKPEIINQLD